MIEDWLFKLAPLGLGAILTFRAVEAVRKGYVSFFHADPNGDGAIWRAFQPVAFWAITAALALLAVFVIVTGLLAF